VKLRRVVVFSLAAVLLAAGLWVVGGNMWAARREEQCDRAWTATFGSLDDLKKKYPKRRTNETAKKLEQLTSGTVFDLTPVIGSVDSTGKRLGTEWNRSQSAVDYLLAQFAKPEASIDPPPEETIRFLNERRVALDAIEALLVAGPPPEWALDLSIPADERRAPNGLGQIRVQRILLARALTAAQGEHGDVSARSLEASWNLNESLRMRPETISALLGIAIARLEVGVLRKVNVEESVWEKRLTALNPRASLLDWIGLHYRLNSLRKSWNAVKNDADRSSFQPVRDFLERPWYRMEMADCSDLMRIELDRLRSSPLSDRSFKAENEKKGLGLAHILASIALPNIRNSFVRADRLVVDAELTSKILEARSLRRENGGRWPAAIPGIEASRYPEASWRYEASPDGGRMSIAFSRALTFPDGQGWKRSLPLRFSSN
jgi:hypothetical protein